MKVILSRKGFDSANGGIASPIFEDGTMVSFPIPSNDRDSYDGLNHNGISYQKLLSDLKYRGARTCHLDPDLDPSRRNEAIADWVPAFGQIDASATYLKNIGIKKGDLFLFFGNFHHVINEDGKYKYVRRTGDFYRDNDLQVIWGYLQVGSVITDPLEQEKLWWHPHSEKGRTSNKTNVILTASETLSFAQERPGAGLLAYDRKRVLTAENANKATWIKNDVYDVEHVLSKRKNNAKDPTLGIYYAGIWQELGLEETEACEAWARSIVL